MRLRDAKILLASIVQYNLEQFEKEAGHKTYVVPMLVSDPGIGKTSVIRQVAYESGLPYHQCIIAQYDAGEMAGLPFKSSVHTHDNKDGKPVYEDRMIRLRPTYLPEEPVGIFNLDELPQAFLANQNIASQLVNEYRVGEHEISAGITICGTGNRPENKAGTTTMPTHLKDRLLFVEIEANLDDFMSYAAENGIDARIRAYLRNNSTNLHKFDPGAKANPTPRSWEKVSAILSMNLPKEIRTQAIGGMIGEGEAVNFEQYLRVEDKLPKMKDIIDHPEKAPVFGNKEADVLYMLLANLADMADEKNIKNIITYIDRLPNQEFAAYWGQDTFKRNPKLLEHKDVTRWKLQSVTKLLY